MRMASACLGLTGRQCARALADGHAVESARRLWRLSLRVFAGHRSVEVAGADAGVFDRPAARERRVRYRRARHHHRRSGVDAEAARQGARLHAALDLPEAQSPSCRWSSARPKRRLAASQLLEQEGYLVVAIRPPTVPEGSARLRFAFSAAHGDEDVDAACRNRAGARAVPQSLTIRASRSSSPRPEPTSARPMSPRVSRAPCADAGGKVVAF